MKVLIRNYRKILIFKPEYTIHNNNSILKDIKYFLNEKANFLTSKFLMYIFKTF